jgi:hypothetical protein
MLTAAVHGDELNGIGVIHRLMEDIDPEGLSGTLIGVPGVNQAGMIANNRHFQLSGGGGSMVDLNRIMPGEEGATNPAEAYVYRLWNFVLKDNADLAIDLHTQTRGTVYPLFVFADYRKKAIWLMATDLMPDIIKRDKGQSGALETTYVEAGIPSVTLEVGAPKQFQHRLISRAVSGIKNVMRRHGMLKGAATEASVAPIIGTSYTNVTTETGGVAMIHVSLLDRVEKGQHVATLYDPHGRVIKKYHAPHGGYILALATDPLREIGGMLVRILQ